LGGINNDFINFSERFVVILLYCVSLIVVVNFYPFHGEGFVMIIFCYLPLNCDWFLCMLEGGICNDFIIIFVCNSGSPFIHFGGSASSDFISLLFPL